MNKKFFRGSFLLSIFVFFFGFIAAQAQMAEIGYSGSNDRQNDELSLTDKRQIIEVLLKEKFAKSSEKTIYISTVNLPDDLQRDFPPVKNKKIRFISAETSNKTSACVYQFGEFEIIGKYVSLPFGNCQEGLAYDFRKFGATWKSVGLTITR